MNFKFLLVLTMVLCVFCILPVNADDTLTEDNTIVAEYEYIPGTVTYNIGTISDGSFKVKINPNTNGIPDPVQYVINDGGTANLGMSLPVIFTIPTTESLSSNLKLHNAFSQIPDMIITFTYQIGTPEPTTPPEYADKVRTYIQTYDYQTGNMLSGVNMSLYEVIDHGEYGTLGRRLFTAQNAESQIILLLNNNTEYFVRNELEGYFAVKNTEYEYLNGETGYLWNITLNNPLQLYYSRLDPTAQYNANFIVQDVNNNGIAGVSVTMDNSITKISNSIGGLTFNNISTGQHTFTFSKNGYQTAQRTINIQLQYAAFYQTLFADNQIIQPTVQPSLYPTIQPTMQPTYTPIDQPSNLGESVKYGLAKMFGVNSLNTINLIFALLIILFPAVVGGVVTNQALGFIAGGLIGFVFALGIGLIPIWVFFSMIMLSVIYLVMTHAESGF